MTDTNISLVEAPWILYCCMRDPAVPGRVKLLVVLLLAYILSPVDLVPDFIPVFGLLDEIIIIPLVLRKIFRLIPAGQLAKYREERATVYNRGLSLLGLFIVTVIWGLILFLIYQLWSGL